MTADGQTLVEALTLDLRAWSKYCPFPNTEERFPPEVNSLCERVVRTDEDTDPAGVTQVRTQGLRLLWRDGGVWGLWRGAGTEERFYNQEVLAAAMTLDGLWEALAARKVAEEAEHRTREEAGQYPNYSLLTPQEWTLVDDIRVESTTGTFAETATELMAQAVGEVNVDGRGFEADALLDVAAADPVRFLRAAGATLAYRVMRREFSLYEDTRGDNPLKRPFPSPLLPGGRPPGWHVRWHHHAAGTSGDGDTGTNTSAPAGYRKSRGWFNRRRRGDVDASDVFIVERDGGGWGLLVHALDVNYIPLTTLYDSAAMTPEGLYRIAEALASLAPAGNGPERVLREFLISRYDLDDPTEQTMATMAALGAPVHHLPKNLR